MNADTLILVTLGTIVIPVNLFPLVYAIRFAWYRSTMGITLFLATFGMMLLVDMSIINRAVNSEAPLVIRAVVYGIIVAASWMQLIILVRAMKRSNKTSNQSGREKEYL